MQEGHCFFSVELDSGFNVADCISFFSLWDGRILFISAKIVGYKLFYPALSRILIITPRSLMDAVPYSDDLAGYCSLPG